MTATHETVLLAEAVTALNINPNGVYVDGTYGRGGHTNAILQALSPQGKVVAIDKDKDALQFAQTHHQRDQRFYSWHGSFGDFPAALAAAGIERPIQGLLLDLGVSSPQLDNAERGFSFMRDGALDMRMDTSQGLTAQEWLAHATEAEIAEVLWRYGEERFSRRIARNIVARRAEKPLATTLELADLVTKSIPKREQGKHPATRSFQAIRIKINQELDEVEKCLQQATARLASGGRLVVISFHSLEDRIVKHYMRAQSTPPRLPKGLPIMDSAAYGNMPLRLVGKATRAPTNEVASNVRARSAIMRVAEKV